MSKKKRRKLNIRKNTKWIINYSKKKYFLEKWFVFKFLRILFFSILILFVIILGLSYLELLPRSFSKITYTSFLEFKLDADLVKDLIIAQISSTFIITAVLSLVSNIDSKYIFGEKAIDRVFKHKILVSISFLILILLMFFNILCLINTYYGFIVFSTIIISFVILAILIFKLMKILFNSKYFENELKILYYKENLKVLEIKMKPITYSSDVLENFFQKCLELIHSKNILFMRYINLYIDLIDKTLFNHLKKVQNYHIELTVSSDFINYYLLIIEELIADDEINVATKYYYKLLSILKYYDAFLHNYYIYSIYLKLLEYNSCINSFVEYKNLFEPISKISSLLIEQVYQFSETDFSFARLGNEYIINTIKIDVFSQLYECIYKNSFLSDVQKNELYEKIFDEFRMSSHNFKVKHADNNAFLDKRVGITEREEKSYLFAFPVFRLLLTCVSLQDKNNFKLFLNMNIGEEIKTHAVILLIISFVTVEKNKDYWLIHKIYENIDFDFFINAIKYSIRYIDHRYIENVYKYVMQYRSTENNVNMGGYSITKLLDYSDIDINSIFHVINKQFTIDLYINDEEINKDIVSKIDNVFKNPIQENKKSFKKRRLPPIVQKK